MQPRAATQPPRRSILQPIRVYLGTSDDEHDLKLVDDLRTWLDRERDLGEIYFTRDAAGPAAHHAQVLRVSDMMLAPLSVQYVNAHAPVGGEVPEAMRLVDDGRLWLLPLWLQSVQEPVTFLLGGRARNLRELTWVPEDRPVAEVRFWFQRRKVWAHVRLKVREILHVIDAREPPIDVTPDEIERFRRRAPSALASFLDRCRRPIRRGFEMGAGRTLSAREEERAAVFVYERMFLAKPPLVERYQSGNYPSFTHFLFEVAALLGEQWSER